MRDQAAVGKKRADEREKMRRKTEAQGRPPSIFTYTADQRDAWAMDLFSFGDKDNNGSLDRDEIKELLETSSFGFNIGSVEDVMSAYDTNKDGVIDKEEFRAMMAHVVAGEVMKWLELTMSEEELLRAMMGGADGGGGMDPMMAAMVMGAAAQQQQQQQQQIDMSDEQRAMEVVQRENPVKLSMPPPLWNSADDESIGEQMPSSATDPAPKPMEVGRVIVAARGIFDDFDEDCEGTIDGQELENLVRRVWIELGMGQPAERDVKREVANMLVRFDLNGDGVISFEEFLGMLCEDPWSLLLPQGGREVIQELLAASRSASPTPSLDKTKSRQSPPSNNSYLARDNAPSALQIAQQIFQEGSADNSNTLRVEDLRSGSLPLKFFNHCGVGREWANTVSPGDVAAQLMKDFDTDRDGVISFREWVALLGHWANLLPNPLRAEFEAEVNRITELNAQSAVEEAKRLFAMGDRDRSGSIDAKELRALLPAFFLQIGFPFQETTQMNLAAQRIMADYDKDGNGVIDFSEWIRMLCEEPWRGFLPAGMRDDILTVAARLSRPLLMRADIKLMGSATLDRKTFVAAFAKAIRHPGSHVHLSLTQPSTVHLLTFYASLFVKTRQSENVTKLMQELRGNVLDQYAVCDWQNVSFGAGANRLCLATYKCILLGEQAGWDGNAAKRDFAQAVGLPEDAISMALHDVQSMAQIHVCVEVATTEPLGVEERLNRSRPSLQTLGDRSVVEIQKIVPELPPATPSNEKSHFQRASRAAVVVV
jgi:Ca2+-binding EF-hand superfamily protein